MLVLPQLPFGPEPPLVLTADAEEKDCCRFRALVGPAIRARRSTAAQVLIPIAFGSALTLILHALTLSGWSCVPTGPAGECEGLQGMRRGYVAILAGRDGELVSMWPDQWEGHLTRPVQENVLGILPDHN